MRFKNPRIWLSATMILSLASGCATSQNQATLVQNASASLALQLTANLSANQTLRVGIMPLTEKTGKAGTMAQALQESLKNRLFLSKRFYVVEDTDMQSVLKQLQIQEQGQDVLKKETIHHMGELLGADAILIGTISDLDSDYLVDCRLVPITSGVVGSAGEVKIAKSATSSGSSRKIFLFPTPDTTNTRYYNSPTYYNQSPSYSPGTIGNRYHY